MPTVVRPSVRSLVRSFVRNTVQVTGSGSAGAPSSPEIVPLLGFLCFFGTINTACVRFQKSPICQPSCGFQYYNLRLWKYVSGTMFLPPSSFTLQLPAP